MARQGQTIAAPATAAGRAAIAVVRISGPRALQTANKITGGVKLEPRRASLRALHDPATGETIDQGLVIWFPSPASFTGEDVVELHVHGGRGVVAALLKALTESCGVALAEPGEFTRRAFENGKLDLTQVEALADLIAAETEAQRRQAQQQLGGALGRRAEEWRESAIRASALVEAAIDFPEEDGPAESVAAARPILERLAADLAKVLQDNRVGERIRDGLRIAIVGPPNAGKSTLMNALAKRDVALVSEHAGTTRDVIEVALDIGGYPAVLIDMAGLREAEEPIEREGVARARARAESADLRIVVWDSTEAVRWQSLGLEPRATDILLLSKSDLRPRGVLPAADWPGIQLSASARTGGGLDALIAALAEHASQGLSAESALVTRARHRHELARALAAVREALAIDPELAELIAEELRAAAMAFGRVTGRIDVEDILDVIFAEFCLGK